SGMGGVCPKEEPMQRTSIAVPIDRCRPNIIPSAAVTLAATQIQSSDEKVSKCNGKDGQILRTIGRVASNLGGDRFGTMGACATKTGCGPEKFGSGSAAFGKSEIGCCDADVLSALKD